MPDLIRVVIADDEAPYRSALERTLKLMPECELLAVCRDGREALDACLADPPDVLLTDINMPMLSGVELTRQLLKKEKGVAVVILTVQEDDDVVYDAFRAGALGYLLKTSTPQDVIEAIRLAQKGEAKITPKIAAKVDRADDVYFRTQIEPLLDDPGVEFIGEINEHQKTQFLGEAQALLFPVDWPEPFGLSMIEAMACGTPVLAFRCGSVAILRLCPNSVSSRGRPPVNCSTER